ncbi:glycoside hydrolase family 64 protein [Massilia pseudoviolaceinigra]|uniref:glycoside hydrolase family 64 protein n=1 Tax=Massilia pseudoviolaceinigra TaxID=3057165 RepID=UPI002796B01D|nr:glycoside hydrolase family 64 protein [Massilia sp. CCM 9206]MDQ1924030.1 glycoside hydrolase family 64 protein [Massilia sp. CCM 9206]
MKKLLQFLSLSMLGIGLLSGCGGSSSGSDATPQPTISATTTVRSNAIGTPTSATLAATLGSSSAPSTTEWTFCANENGECIFTGNQTVRYGAGSSFTSKKFDWAASCNNASFGTDPAPGVAKHCEITSSFAFCANENGQCGFGDTQTVRFGAGSTYVTQTVTGGAACTTGVFGDPLPGSAKHCDRAPTTWTRCALENGRCNFSGTQVLLYGANGSFFTKTLSNGADCNSGVFGDPIPGVPKRCYLPGVPMPSGATPPTPGDPGGTWNQLTTFKLVNGTRGQYADSQVYWAIIGKDWSSGKYVHVDAGGRFIPMALSDNGALSKNGKPYTNYFHTLAQLKSITIPPLNSARLFLSVGSPMYLQVNADANGNLGYAGANIENPSDPNIDVYFDFIEMSIGAKDGFFGNTTRVDHFGFPLTLRLQGLGGYDQTVGETETRASLISQFVASVPAQFKGLAQAPYAPYRIIAPAHASFQNGGANATYLDGYINHIWNKYASQKLVFTNQQGTFSGQVVNGVFQFTDGAGTYNVRKPTTAMALLGNGALDDPSGTVGGTPAYHKQLQIQAQLCAALNRHVVEDPARWSDSAYFYPAGQPANWYAKFWHDHSINKLAYGFAYDDVWNYSSSVHSTAPTTATVTIGW